MPDSNPDPCQPPPIETSAAASAGVQPECGDKPADGTRQRIRQLPPEVGAVLITVGVAGIILPGPIGTPLLLAGGLALMPSVFGRLERWFERRFPKAHYHGMRNVDRFIDDLEKRFPPEPHVEEPASK
jgi:hypothetical protein